MTQYVYVQIGFTPEQLAWLDDKDQARSEYVRELVEEQRDD